MLVLADYWFALEALCRAIIQNINLGQPKTRPNQLGGKMNFVVLDFETTSLKHPVGCEIGLVKVVDGVIVDSYSSLIKQAYMSEDSQAVHGISLEELSDAPALEEILADIVHFIGDSDIVAHYAMFDGQVLKNMGFHEYLDGNKIFCSLHLSQRLLDLPAYKLGAVAAHYGIVNSDAHRALGDAMTTALVAIRLLNGRDLKSAYIEAALKPGKISSIGVMHPGKNKVGHVYWNAEQRDRYTQLLAESDKHPHPDWLDQEVAFTGDIPNYTRLELNALAVKMGAIPKVSVNKNTKYVIIGENPGPSKIEKIDFWRFKGSKIVKLDVQEFLAAIEEAENMRLQE